jgi:hypothetical protein
LPRLKKDDRLLSGCVTNFCDTFSSFFALLKLKHSFYFHRGGGPYEEPDSFSAAFSHWIEDKTTARLKLFGKQWELKSLQDVPFENPAAPDGWASI